LKLELGDPGRGVGRVSPGLTAGGGLKPSGESAPVIGVGVSPGLTAGGGLKQAAAKKDSSAIEFPPASPPGAD